MKKRDTLPRHLLLTLPGTVPEHLREDHLLVRTDDHRPTWAADGDDYLIEGSSIVLTYHRSLFELSIIPGNGGRAAVYEAARFDLRQGKLLMYLSPVYCQTQQPGYPQTLFVDAVERCKDCDCWRPIWENC